jgi:hypothetical protein
LAYLEETRVLNETPELVANWVIGLIYGASQSCFAVTFIDIDGNFVLTSKLLFGSTAWDFDLWDILSRLDNLTIECLVFDLTPDLKFEVLNCTFALGVVWSDENRDLVAWRKNVSFDCELCSCRRLPQTEVPSHFVLCCKTNWAVWLTNRSTYWELLLLNVVVSSLKFSNKDIVCLEH